MNATQGNLSGGRQNFAPVTVHCVGSACFVTCLVDVPSYVGRGGEFGVLAQRVVHAKVLLSPTTAHSLHRTGRSAGLPATQMLQDCESLMLRTAKPHCCSMAFLGYCIKNAGTVDCTLLAIRKGRHSLPTTRARRTSATTAPFYAHSSFCSFLCC